MYVSEPMTDDQPLMRYLSHDKFVRLLNHQQAIDAWNFLDPPANGTVIWTAPTPVEYGALWMSFPQSFRANDPDEGMFPALNASDEAFCDLAAHHLGLTSEEAEQRKQDFLSQNSAALRERIRARTELCGVSCWYQSVSESQRMWHEYVPDGKGVIVKTTVKQFEEAIGWTIPQYSRAAKPMFATINYVDREKFFLVNDGYYHLLAIKGEGFKHEREVRLIAKSPELVRATANDASPTIDEITALVDTAGKGFNVLIDLKRLISEIRVYPNSPSEYTDTIKAEIERSGISADIVKTSELSTS